MCAIGGCVWPPKQGQGPAEAVTDARGTSLKSGNFTALEETAFQGASFSHMPSSHLEVWKPLLEESASMLLRWLMGHVRPHQECQEAFLLSFSS